MSEIANAPGPSQDEFFLDTPALRTFIAEVRRVIAAHTVTDDAGNPQTDVVLALDTLRPTFAALLADQTWLSDEFAAPYAASGMGGGIGNWVLFRAADRDLSLFSLVVPSGSQTPVHDHLAWGYVGVYRGEQEETVYHRQDQREDGESSHPTHAHAHDHSHAHSDTTEEVAHLTVAEVNHLQPGDFYKLIPPYGDIHAVETTSLEPSVSIHLLANDTGCIVRHAFDVERGVVRAFRSGYSNVACDVDQAAETA